MAYDIRSRSNVVQFDIGADQSTTVAKRSPPPTLDTSQGQGRLRGNDGVVGAAQFPTSAELVFLDPHDEPPPAYDDGDDNGSNEGSNDKVEPSRVGNGFTSKLAKAADSLQSWQDLRSQRKFVSNLDPFRLVCHTLLMLLSSSGVCSKERTQPA